MVDDLPDALASAIGEGSFGCYNLDTDKVLAALRERGFDVVPIGEDVEDEDHVVSTEPKRTDWSKVDLSGFPSAHLMDEVRQLTAMLAKGTRTRKISESVFMTIDDHDAYGFLRAASKELGKRGFGTFEGQGPITRVIKVVSVEKA